MWEQYAHYGVEPEWPKEMEEGEEEEEPLSAWQLQQVLQWFPDVFSEQPRQMHKIPTPLGGGLVVVQTLIWPLPLAPWELVRQEVDKMLALGVNGSSINIFCCSCLVLSRTPAKIPRFNSPEGLTMLNSLLALFLSSSSQHSTGRKERNQ